MADVVVIGGGPAGLAAARAAALRGAAVVLIDENRRLGGQYYRDMPPEARALIDEILGLGVDVRLDSVVWSIFDRRTVAVASGDVGSQITAETIVLAPGAFDRPVPFPGWTLPGVLTAGGAQNLMKSFGIVPGRRVLIAGSGPLLLVVAHYLIHGGAQVVALCESASMRGRWRYAARMLPHWDFLRQGFGYWSEIRRAGIPILNGTIVRRAFGTDAVSAVEIARCNEEWRPIPNTERRFDVDTLVVGYGFLSSTELARLCGCELAYREDLDGWVPVRNAEMETTVPGIFAVGDGAGVAGSAVALAEGEIVGIAVARRLGKISEKTYARDRAPVDRKLKRLAAFRGVMDELYQIRPGLYDLADSATIVCRCEEITRQTVESTIDEGAASPTEVKALSRLGMGRCQGRMCGSTLERLIAMKTGRPLSIGGSLTTRPPVKPIPLGALIAR